MDQPQENTPASQQVRKKTLRDVYANAASGLLLMINESWWMRWRTLNMKIQYRRSGFIMFPQ
jgi:hypothetical protein